MLKSLLIAICKIIFIFSFSLLANAEQRPELNWIWGSRKGKADYYFRKDFNIGNIPGQARLYISADDFYDLYVNGHCLREKKGNWSIPEKYDISKFLKSGKNTIAVKASNIAGPGGLLCLVEAGKQSIGSDSTWKYTDKPADAWTSATYDVSSWHPAKVIGNITCDPWQSVLFNCAYLMQKYCKPLIKNTTQLTKNKIMIEIRKHNGTPTLFLNEKPVQATMYGMTEKMQDTGSEKNQKLIRQFSQTGIRLFSFYSYMRDIRNSPGKVDYTYLDYQISQLLSADPNACIMLRVHLDMPQWWMEAHPDEMTGYSSSAEVVNGSDSDASLRPSMASEIWLKTAESWLQDYIKHVEKSPWANQVIGYHIAYGVYGEWHYWGFPEFPDNGKAMTRYFRQWLKIKYHDNLIELKHAWDNNSVSFKNALVPDTRQRLGTADGLFRLPGKDGRSIDYYQCQQQAVRDAFLNLCKAARKVSGSKLLGGFYGYFFCMVGISWQAEAGHLELNKVLESPFVDFLCAPFSYEKNSREADGDGCMRSLTHSISLHGKLFFNEIDCPTYLGDYFKRDLADWKLNTPQGSIQAIKRDICNVTTAGTGMWWFDFGPDGEGGWWSSPELMNIIKKSYKIGEEALKHDRSSAAQLAVVVNMDSFYYTASGKSGKDKLTYPLLNDIIHKLYRSGVCFDLISTADLRNFDVSQYKAYIFLNTFKLADCEKAVIKDKVEKNKNTVLWIYAPGYTDGQLNSAENISNLIGIKLKKLPELPARVTVDNFSFPMTGALSARSKLRNASYYSPIPAFLMDKQEIWTSYRTSSDIKNHYSYYKFKIEEDPEKGKILNWQFKTKGIGYNDIHGVKKIGQKFDKIGCWIKNKSTDKAMFWLKLTENDGSEFKVAPVCLKNNPDKWQWVEFELEDYSSAPWAKDENKVIDFPLTKIVPVVVDISPQKDYEILISDFYLFRAKSKKKIFQYGLPVDISPAFEVTDSRAVPLGHTGESITLVAKIFPEWQSIYSYAVPLSSDFLRAFCKYAGVHIYSYSDDIIFANASFVGVNCSKAGRKTIMLPHKSFVKEMFSQKRLEKATDRISFNASENSAYLFLIEKSEK